MAPKPWKFTFSTHLPEVDLFSLPGFSSDDIERMLGDILQLLSIHEIVTLFFEPASPRLAIDFQDIIESDMADTSYTAIEVQAAVRLYLLQNNDRYNDIHVLMTRFHSIATAVAYLRGHDEIDDQREAEIVSIARSIHNRTAEAAATDTTPSAPLTTARPESIASSQLRREDPDQNNSRAIVSEPSSSLDTDLDRNVLQQIAIIASRITVPSSAASPLSSQTSALISTAESTGALPSNVNDGASSTKLPAKKIILRLTTSKAEEKEEFANDDDHGTASEDSNPESEFEIFKDRAKNTPGPKGYKWETLEGHVHTEARRGHPDPNLFVIILRGTHDKTKKKIVYAWSYRPQLVLDFDWNNSEHVSRLNRWRAQVIRRATGALAHEYREAWTEVEAIALRDIISEMLRKQDYYSIDWDMVSRRLNEQFQHRTIPTGSIIAISSASRKGDGSEVTRGGKTTKNRVGANRNSNSCKNQAGKLALVKPLLDSARAKSSKAKKSTKGGKKRKAKSSEEEEDEDEDDEEEEVTDDKIDKDDRKDDNDEDESPRGPSRKRQKYTA